MKPVGRVVYVLKCNMCDKEGYVREDVIDYRCSSCQLEARYQENMREAIAAQRFILQATITSFKMKDKDEFESLTIRALNGIHYVFTAEGWDERYIGIDEEVK